MCHAKVSKPIETSCGVNRKALWQSQQDALRAGPAAQLVGRRSCQRGQTASQWWFGSLLVHG